MGGLIGGAAAGLGGAYLQKRAQNKATERQNELIGQQAMYNNAMAIAYQQDFMKLSKSYAEGTKAVGNQAFAAQKKVISTLPFPGKSATKIAPKTGLDYNAKLGRSALMGG